MTVYKVQTSNGVVSVEASSMQEAVQVATAMHGAEPPATEPKTSDEQPLQSPVTGLVMGALKGLGKTALGAGKLVKSAGGFGELSPQDAAAFDPATWGLNPQGIAEKIGQGAERVGEFAAGGAAMKLPKAASVLGNMAKLATEVGSVSSVQQGSIPEGAVTGAVASLLPPALTAISKVSPRILAEGAANYVTGGKYKLAMSMLDKVLTKGAMPFEAAAAGYSEAQWQATVKAAQQEVRMMEAAEKEAAKATKAAEKAGEKIKPGTTTPENWAEREPIVEAIMKSRAAAMKPPAMAALEERAAPAPVAAPVGAPAPVPSDVQKYPEITKAMKANGFSREKTLDSLVSMGVTRGYANILVSLYFN